MRYFALNDPGNRGELAFTPVVANLGVRALPSFNTKVREARAKGAKLGRKVETDSKGP